MCFTAKTPSNGVAEHHFIPGHLAGAPWSPSDATGVRPLVPPGHGGGRHKKVPGTVHRAHRCVTAGGSGTLAPAENG